MNPRTASALAALFCTGVVLAVVLFGYTRYRVAQRENAEFSRSLLMSSQQQGATMQAHMPSQLGPHTSSISAGSTPTPDSNGGLGKP